MQKNNQVANMTIKQAFVKLKNDDSENTNTICSDIIIKNISAWLLNSIKHTDFSLSTQIKFPRKEEQEIVSIHKDELVAHNGALSLLINEARTKWENYSCLPCPLITTLKTRGKKTSLFKANIKLEANSEVTIAFVILVLLDILEKIEFK